MIINQLVIDKIQEPERLHLCGLLILQKFLCKKTIVIELCWKSSIHLHIEKIDDLKYGVWIEVGMFKFSEISIWSWGFAEVVKIKIWKKLIVVIIFPIKVDWALIKQSDVILNEFRLSSGDFSMLIRWMNNYKVNMIKRTVWQILSWTRAYCQIS
jgi:hypothetical protein